MNDMWVLSLLAIPIAFLFFVLIEQYRYLKRRIKRLQTELDEAKLKHEAAKLKFEATFSGFDPIECEECHLPGDCPLCGAK